MSENDTRFAGGDDTPLSPREAFGLMNPPEMEQDDAPPAEHEEPATPPDEGDDGAAPDESAIEADAAPPEEEPSGETDGQDDPADDLPSIEPPRSWTKEDKAHFAGLPRETQERLVELDRTRELEVRRSQNEAAESLKAAQAQQQAAEQARQHYEQQLPNLLQAVQSAFQQEFSDVQNWDDVQTMARDDPGRYLQWQAMREKGLAVQRQMQEAQTRQQRESAERLQSFMREETDKFLARAPEFADQEKAPQLQAQARDVLVDVGFAPEEIQQAWVNGGSVNVHDHRFQLLVRDAMRYRNAQKAVKKAAPAPKPVPQVQRPGPAPNRKAEQRTEHFQALDKQLDRTGSRDAALALIRARRAG